jgi:predicted RNase H-like nuclease (RuvC/YqgF family)
VFFEDGMDSTMKTKFGLVSKYMSRTIIKMFTPQVAKEFEYLLEDLTENEESFGRKIDQAYNSLQDTSRLVERLESKLKMKIESVEKLKVELERYSQLAELEKPKVAALISQLDLTVNKGKTKERVYNFLISIVAGLCLFVFGVWASPFVKPWFGI